MEWTFTGVTCIGFSIALLSFNLSTCAHYTTTSEGKHANCGVLKSQIMNVKEIMKNASTLLGQTEFTNLQADWESSCAKILEFLETKTLHVNETSKFLETLQSEESSTVKALRARHEKEVSYLRQLVQSLKIENDEIKTKQEVEFQAKLAVVDADVKKLKLEIKKSIETKRRLQLDLIYIHISQENFTSARYHTDDSITAEDIGKLMLKIYSDSHQNESVLTRIFRYLSGGTSNCGQLKTGLKSIVDELQHQDKFKGINVIWAGEIAYVCKNHGLQNYLNELSVHSEKIIKTWATQIRNKNFTDVQTIELELWKIGRGKYTCGCVTRALLQQFHVLTVNNITHEGEGHFLDDFIQYIFQGCVMCNTRIFVIHELLQSFNGSRFGYDLVIYKVLEFLRTTERTDCFGARTYFECIYAGLKNNKQDLSVLNDSCISQ